jgi:hypothetical protein
LILIQHGSTVLNLSFKILIHVALSENRKQKTENSGNFHSLQISKGPSLS